MGLLGSADENLRALERLLAADIHARGNVLTLSGEPADVALARRIHGLLNEQGYTVKGVQKLLRSKGADEPSLPTLPAAVAPQPYHGRETPSPAVSQPIDIDRLKFVRDQLAAALRN